MAKKIICGIDLGTSSCKVCLLNEEQDTFEMIDFDGSNYMPSVVIIENDRIIVGVEQASSNGVMITESKRLMQTKFNEVDPEVLKKLPYQVINHNGYCGIPITFKGQNYILTPTHVAAILLHNIKLNIQRNMPSVEEICVVVTVPAQFRDEQKDETIRAVEMAGMTFLKIIDEPIAAAYCYEDESRNGGSKIVNGPHIVVDVGHGTIDVTVNKKKTIGGTEMIEVIAPVGDCSCGSFNMDMKLTDFFIDQICDICGEEKREMFNPKTKNGMKNIYKTRKIAESTKKELSIHEQFSADLSTVDNEIDQEIVVSREEFEEQIEEVTEKIRAVILKGIEESQLDEEDFKHILLAGGGSHIPRVEALIKEIFENCDCDIKKYSDVDVAVARGAAIYAKMNRDGIQSLISEVIIHDIKLMGYDGQLHTVLSKGTPITTQHEFYVQAAYSDAYVDVYENNTQLGHFVVSPTRAGECYLTHLRFDENKRLLVQVDVGDRQINGVNVQRQANQNENKREDERRFIESFFN